MKNVFLVLFVILFTYSCTEPKNVKTTGEVVNVKEVKKEFIVAMSFKTNKEDSFKLALNNIVIDEFQKKNILIIEKVSPSSGFETLTANFGENSSSNFSINFGNKEVKEVEINSIEISYGENKLNISANELSKYFSLNKFVSLDTISNKITTKKIDGKHSPSISFKKKTIKLLITE